MQADAPLHLTAIASTVTTLRAPPSIQELTFLAQDQSDYPWFQALVLQYLPNEAGTILSTPGRIDQFAQFLDIFQEHYFPLSPLVFPDPDLHLQGYDAFPPWSILRDGVPFDLMGITYDQLHDLWEFSTPTLPSLALLCDMTSHYWLDNGIRPYWTEAARAHLPDSLLKAIPPEGYPPHRIRAAVAGTFYAPTSTAVDWLFSQTGNFFLDNALDEENLCVSADPWEPDIIALGTTQWHQARSLMNDLNDFLEWLSHDLPKNLGLVLTQINNNAPGAHPQ